jgi:hypothetical protein
LKKEGATGPYLSLDPVKYAQTLTMATVNTAPARPETINLASKIAGKTDASQGNAYSAKSWAITPAKNPKSATIANILILSPINFHL